MSNLSLTVALLAAHLPIIVRTMTTAGQGCPSIPGGVVAEDDETAADGTDPADEPFPLLIAVTPSPTERIRLAERLDGIAPLLLVADLDELRRLIAVPQQRAGPRRATVEPDAHRRARARPGHRLGPVHRTVRGSRGRPDPTGARPADLPDHRAGPDLELRRAAPVGLARRGARAQSGRAVSGEAAATQVAGPRRRCHDRGRARCRVAPHRPARAADRACLTAA